MIEACCDRFGDVSCDPKYEVGHEFDVSESKPANKCAEKSVSALTGPSTETCVSSTVLAEHPRSGLKAF